MTPADLIVEWYRQRRDARAPELNMAHRIRDAYNGTIVLPLPELNRNEQAAVANLIKQGVNQEAVRAGSTLPTLLCPPVKETKTAYKEADIRRKCMAGWWTLNDFKKKQYRRLRHFIAYASSPVIIRPDFKRGIPEWVVWDPLATYSAPSSDLDNMEPCDTIHAFTRSYGWLRYNYPNEIVGLDGADRAKPDDLFQILEFVNEEEHVLVVLGKSSTPQYSQIWTPAEMGDSGYKGDKFKELRRLPNRAKCCTVLVPGRITLDRPQGGYDGQLPLFIKRARLAALEEIAVEKGVFENEWFVADTDQGDIVVEADGRLGQVGHVVGGKMEWHTVNVGSQINIALDRMERQERTEGSIPAEWGAESGSNIRTDKRGNTIMAAAQDPRMIETHDVMAESYRKELQRAVAVAKGYFGDTPKSFYVDWKGASGPVTYRPSVTFADSDEVVVRWAMPGSDINNLTIAGGQRVQMGTMSKRDFMEIDPLVDDVEESHDRIIAEQLEQAMLGALQQQAATGAIPPNDVARIMDLVRSNKMELAEAIQKVHEEAQARQASVVPPGSPEAQPGLAVPGAGAEAGGTPPPQDLQGLSALMSNLRGPMRQTPAERGAAA